MDHSFNTVAEALIIAIEALYKVIQLKYIHIIKPD